MSEFHYTERMIRMCSFAQQQLKCLHYMSEFHHTVRKILMGLFSQQLKCLHYISELHHTERKILMYLFSQQLKCLHCISEFHYTERMILMYLFSQHLKCLHYMSEFHHIGRKILDMCLFILNMWRARLLKLRWCHLPRGESIILASLKWIFRINNRSSLLPDAIPIFAQKITYNKEPASDRMLSVKKKQLQRYSPNSDSEWWWEGCVFPRGNQFLVCVRFPHDDGFVFWPRWTESPEDKNPLL